MPFGEAGFSLAIEEESVPSGFINSFLLYIVGCKIRDGCNRLVVENDIAFINIILY